MAYGLTSTGFFAKPLDVQLQELRDDFQSTQGVVPTGAAEKWLEALALAFTELWELVEAVNASKSRDAAGGEQLDAVNALTGTNREAEDSSSVDLTLTGTPTTVVDAGKRASATSSGSEFATLDSATIALLAARTTTTVYALGARATNGGNAYQVITAGTTGGGGGPTTTSLDITDGSVHWRYLGAGTGAVDVAAEAVETGPLVAESGDIATIVTPVSGWSNVVNLLDADVGSYLETDELFRLRGEDELARGGDGTVDALRTDLLDIADVLAVTVFHNPTDVTDADGVPPHTVEALVRGGEDQDIYDSLLEHVAAGIGTYGTETGSADDDEGTSHVVRFTRPDEIEIYVDVELIVDALLYPEDGDDQVIAAMITFADGFSTGRNVTASGLSAQAFAIAGVLDVTLLQIGTAPAPSSSATIAIALRELAVLDSSRFTIVSTPGTP